MTHTKGPWHQIHDEIAWTDSHTIYNGSEQAIAHTTRGFGSAEQQANARLIAAAPDLLEALKAIISDTERPSDDPCGYSLDYATLMVARDAIAKAEGGEA